MLVLYQKLYSEKDIGGGVAKKIGKWKSLKPKIDKRTDNGIEKCM